MLACTLTWILIAAWNCDNRRNLERPTCVGTILAFISCTLILFFSTPLIFY